MSASDASFWKVVLRSVCIARGYGWEMRNLFLQNYQSWFVIHLSLFSSFYTGCLRALWWELCRCSTVSRMKSRGSTLSLHLSSDHSLSIIVFRSVNTVCWLQIAQWFQESSAEEIEALASWVQRKSVSVKPSSKISMRVFLYGQNPSRGNGKIRLGEKLCISFHESCAFIFWEVLFFFFFS